jgi:hypothetical protein
MFLNNLSKSFLDAIGGILELHTCSVIVNCVRAFNINVFLQQLNTDKCH